METVNHRDVLRLIAEGAQVVDALPAHEYNPVHLPGAIHLPLRKVLSDAPRMLTRDRAIVVYCRDSL